MSNDPLPRQLKKEMLIKRGFVEAPSSRMVKEGKLSKNAKKRHNDDELLSILESILTGKM
jgi:hypothetical protein